ncbi:hypothetical protein [Maridesulfovibrio hydrothermalis]|uniref:Tetratricopeptide repeat protein n=1 Tax=Maridesulfovibrio hydrothermalis AM13 = DSM 14728 TaxID=1121451 RepID=L0R8M6_9BACT|nr:hypothetical protein [Maridesulfovibrio hydrothermalis]CCO23109.1 conserved protein of unknown function [Maridesulfovibrio hydrothermalis AM13 = DSM 14728]
MSNSWIKEKIPEFIRDTFRDFCLAGSALEEQFETFDRERSVSFEALDDLIGTKMNKGLLWRLKDTAHLLFLNEEDGPLSGRFLDWGMGYIFHEAFKLREDAYQNLNYAPLFSNLRGRDTTLPESLIGQDFVQVIEQTEESMEREISRIRFIISRCRKLFPIYLSNHSDNSLVGRLLYSQSPLIREVFREEYEVLVDTIYGDEPEMLYVLASRSLRMGGWMDNAVHATRQAYKLNPKNPKVLQEKEIVDNWSKRVKV